MSRRIVAFSLPLLALVALGARKPSDPKHENHYKSVAAPAVSGFNLDLIDAQSQQQFAQVNVKITNPSADTLVILKKNEAEFVLPAGTYTAKAPTFFPGPMVVPPNDSKNYMWKVEDSTNFHVDSFTLRPKGFATAPSVGTPVTVPDFALPASRNDFTAGPFSCTLKNTKQTTDNTEAVFVCTYNGKGVGMVEPAKIGWKEPGGKEYANITKGKRAFLFPGEDTKVNAAVQIPKSVVDMQFATLQVLFRDAFSESAVTPVAVPDWAFEVDPAKTAEANK